MKRTISILLLVLVQHTLAGPGEISEAPRQFRRLSLSEYRDRMKAGWVGQMAGVSWGASTEFKYAGVIIPARRMPRWRPRMINDAFAQDDLYVEMTFLRSLEQHGFDVSIRQAGIDYANNRFPPNCPFAGGRNNIRRGIAPPNSGHPLFNTCPDDIEYQIEADFSGLIAPGLPSISVEMGEKFGRLMNYGDGVYAGQFIGAMYSEAFFDTNVLHIVQAGLQAIPSGSQYAEMVRDMLSWSGELPAWEDCWKRCEEKYRRNPVYQKSSNGGIDCKINGAYVLTGLLYGRGDPDQTMIIACRCGQDSDCNPSSAGGVIFTTFGFSKLPARFKDGLREASVFTGTAYDFPTLLNVCERLARESVLKEGGRVERDAKGEECFVIPVKPATPGPLECSWTPGPISDSKFTEAELSRITVPPESAKPPGSFWEW